jgi:hypothetical protein
VVKEDLLVGLRALAAVRQNKGDSKLILNPDPLSFERTESPNDFDGNAVQGLVLEPFENAPFEIHTLAKRKHQTHIEAFCDGTRSTYFVGHEHDLPLIYTHNASVVRTRNKTTGYHTSLYNIQRHQAMFLAPFDLFPPAMRQAYQQLNLYSNRLADLCWTGIEEGYASKPSDMETMGNLGWQRRARRRARHLLDLSEQITSITGAQLLREYDTTGKSWLLKDGSLFQFKREHLRLAEPLRNIVSCVKTHPVAFFGAEAERQLRGLKIGERSVAFLPRPTRESQKRLSLRETDRQMVSWYIRVRQANQHDANHMSGIVRLDIAAIEDWRNWIDEVSWAILDEFYGISAMPDPRYDVMPYGIYDCEQFLKACEISGDLLLAQLR